jgi:protein involved in polysaccharide export with SLBB domain
VFVAVTGEVEYPGQYALETHNERLSHVIARAGGMSPSGYARGARLTRDGTALRLNLEDALEGIGGPSDIVLKPGDAISVPRKPGTVTIRGEVQNPGIYGYVEKESFGDYLERAGGETDSSDFAVITFPEGNSKQVGLGWFSRNPTIPDGSDILVTKVPPEPPEPVVKEGQTTYDFVKDTLAIVVSSVTIIVLASKL